MLLLLDSKVEKSFLWKSHCFLIDTQGPELGIKDCQGPALSPPHLPASLGLLSVELRGHGARPDGKDGENCQKGGKQEVEGGL